VAPKNGVTHRKVLRAAGLDVDLDIEQAAARVSNPKIGWAYVDQKAFCPALYGLRKLRELIVKRPALSTAETLSGPIRGRKHTHLITGYVHKGYPPIYARLAREAGFTSAALVRGIEGGVLPSLRQMAKLYYYYDDGELELKEIDPADIGIKHSIRALPLPENLATTAEDEVGVVNTNALAQATAAVGLEALDGASGAACDSLVYGGAIALTHLRRFNSLRQAAQAVSQSLDRGDVRRHFLGTEGSETPDRLYVKRL
jgi:anthranilate phosphoribosyltransferase